MPVQHVNRGVFQVQFNQWLTLITLKLPTLWTLSISDLNMRKRRNQTCRLSLARQDLLYWSPSLSRAEKRRRQPTPPSITTNPQNHYKRSTIIAIPCPPPMHAVASPYLPFRLPN